MSYSKFTSFISKKITVSNFGLFGSIASIISLTLFLINAISYNLFIVILFSTIVFLSIALIKAQNLKYEIGRIYNTYHKIHDIVHDYRNSLSGYKINEIIFVFSQDQFQKHFNDVVRNVLNSAVDVFSHLTESRCVANIMFYEKSTEGGHLNTSLYSSTATLDRTKDSKPLPSDLGLAGAAFKDGNHIYINNNYSDPKGKFCKIRNNYLNFYNSGMSAPINVDKVPCGVLNIDSIETYVFNDKLEHIMAIYADMLSAILQTFNFCYVVRQEVSKN